MCEIAVLDPSEVYAETAQQVLDYLHRTQGDGIGVVMVLNEGDAFRYETYKSTTPHWATVYSFLVRYWDRSWRVVLHGRNATSGQVNRNTAHPIRVDCDHCEFDHVVHNGSVRRYEDKQESLREDGHTLSTEVDTEIIAHKVSELPDDVDDLTSTTYDFYGNLNYLLFSEEGILVRSDSRYHLADNFTMTCSPDLFSDPEALAFDTSAENGWALITPDGSVPTIETAPRSKYKRSGSTRRGQRGYRNWVSGGGTGSRASSSGTHTIEYEDLSNYPEVTAVRVAPGTIKVIDEESERSMFVTREEDPRLYFWYAPEDRPENMSMDELEGYASDTEQAPLDDFPNARMTEAIAEEVATTIAGEISSVTIRDVAEIDDDLAAAINNGQESAMAVEALDE